MYLVSYVFLLYIVLLNIAELNIETVTTLGFIILKKYMSLKVKFFEFFSLENDEDVKILNER